jgi:hypothetical protein
VPFFVPRQRGTKILVSISSPPKPKNLLETPESQYLYGQIDSRNDELIIGRNYWSIYLFMGLNGLGLMVYGLWFAGLWFVVCGLWFVVCGLWFMFRV